MTVVSVSQVQTQCHQIRGTPTWCCSRTHGSSAAARNVCTQTPLLMHTHTHARAHAHVHTHTHTSVLAPSNTSSPLNSTELTRPSVYINSLTPNSGTKSEDALGSARLLPASPPPVPPSSPRPPASRAAGTPPNPHRAKHPHQRRQFVPAFAVVKMIRPALRLSVPAAAPSCSPRLRRCCCCI